MKFKGANTFQTLSGKILCKSIGLNLTLTLLGGQSFRWKQISELKPTTRSYFQGVFSEHVWNLWNDDTHLFYEVFSKNKLIPQNIENILKSYLRLDVDLAELYEDWSKKDHHFKQTCSEFTGIRMLNQNLVENIFSFLCSSNNNIARISGMIDKMCTEYGDEICNINGVSFHSFPRIEKLSKPNVEMKLRELGFGYRAKFIQKSAEYIEQNGGEIWLEKLKKMNYEDARVELQKLQGIGAKVADCISLMSLSHLQSVPVDTHVYQIACNHYNYRSKQTSKTLTPTMYKDIRDFFIEKFGEYAGWAHSILFCADLKKFQGNEKESIKKKIKKEVKDNIEKIKAQIKKEIVDDGLENELNGNKKNGNNVKGKINVKKVKGNIVNEMKPEIKEEIIDDGPKNELNINKKNGRNVKCNVKEEIKEVSFTKEEKKNVKNVDPVGGKRLKRGKVEVTKTRSSKLRKVKE